MGNHIKKFGNVKGINKLKITMKANNPIFADLSTYDPNESISFYENIFDWKFYKEYDYYTAYQKNDPIIGLYETPEKFKQMRMPHFWMTYFQVENVAETVNRAKALDGIIEITEEIRGYGKVALIRDPQGSGFTIYEGNSLKNTRTQSTANTLVWNELHISNISKTLPFYLGIFDWSSKEADDGIFQIYNGKNEYIVDILTIPNELKGKYEYWISTFGVSNLKATKMKILENGGSLVYDEGQRILFTDNSGQAFFYITEV
jgi:uncharacterized protein